MKGQADLRYEYRLWQRGYRAVAGLDEAGRGAWAGPVVAGAVILPVGRFDLARALSGVNDSKQLTPAQREALVARILRVAVAAAVGQATHAEIDEQGIVPATRLAMQRALEALPTAPDALLTDAMALPAVRLPVQKLVRGDQRALSVAAASILAKVARDRLMDALDTIYPEYGFGEHKGYGTVLHRQQLRTFGVSPVHRRSFAPVRAFLTEEEGR